VRAARGHVARTGRLRPTPPVAASFLTGAIVTGDAAAVPIGFVCPTNATC
jgi:hypothetical protein